MVHDTFNGPAQGMCSVLVVAMGDEYFQQKLSVAQRRRYFVAEACGQLEMLAPALSHGAFVIISLMLILLVPLFVKDVRGCLDSLLHQHRMREWPVSLGLAVAVAVLGFGAFALFPTM